MVDDSSLGRRVALAGIAASAILAAINVAVGLIANSKSVLATGAEFAGDVIASSIVLVGLVIATRPADANHPYGHGRVETLAAFSVGFLLAVGGIGVCWQSLQGIGEKHTPPSELAIASLLIAIVVRGLMSIAKFRVGRRIRSAALVADAWNDTVDILGASAALTAVSLTLYNPDRFLAADHYGGFAVGLIVVLTGIRVARDASLELVDTMPDRAMLEELRASARMVPGVINVEKGYARKTGFKYHVELHIEVDPSLTVAASHEIARNVRAQLSTTVPWVADVLVHVEPAHIRGAT